MVDVLNLQEPDETPADEKNIWGRSRTSIALCANSRYSIIKCFLW